MSLFATKLVDEYGGTTYNLTGHEMDIHSLK